MRRATALAAALGAAIAAAVAPGSQAGCFAAGRSSAPRVVCLGSLPASRASLVLKQWGRSSEHGVAWIVFGLHQTKVVIRLQGQPEGSVQPAVLRRGRCGKGAPSYRLGNVVNGRRTAKLDSLEHVSGYALEIRKSSGSSAMVACGVIPPHHP